jgi:tetratricopeptide (TPR) repeat protein
MKRRPKPASRTPDRVWVAGIAAATTLAFLNALRGEFVYDDHFQIVDNATLRSLSNLPRVFFESVWQFMDSRGAETVGLYYRPVFNAALILIYRVAGLRVFAWHVVSLCLHVACAILLFRIARRWESTPVVAGAAALFFGLHPIHSESVAWIAALPDPLALAALLASVLLYERHYHGDRARRADIVASVALAFVATLSKELAVVFPLWLFTREFLQDGRRRERLVMALRRTAAFWVASIMSILLRIAVLGFLTRPEPHAVAIPTTAVLLTIPAVLAHYARTLVVPYPLAIAYDLTYVTSASDPRFYLPLITLLVLGAVAVRLLRHSTIAMRWTAWIVLFLLPVLSLRAFNQQESLVHDRYLYVPSVGFCALLALAIDKAGVIFRQRRAAAFASVAFAISIAYAAATVAQNRTWRDDVTLMTHALRVSPQRAFLHNYLGAHHFQRRELDTAQAEYQKALTIDASYYDAISNLADVYHLRGEYPEAKRLYQRAIALGAPYANSFLNLGVVEIALGDYGDAETSFRRTIELQPSSEKAHYNLGWVYGARGKFALSESEYRATLRLNPAHADARANLAGVLLRQGRIAEARSEIATIQRVAPNHPALPMLMRAIRQ